MPIRRIPSSDCLVCRRTVFESEEARAETARHRLEHRRADRRRASWRASKQRRKMREIENVDGYLHNIGCKYRHYMRFNGCTPIPVWRPPAGGERDRVGDS